MLIKKAARKQSKLKLAITGSSGAGKTYSALRLAKGLGDKIAVIDTENGSASLYSDDFNFDVIELHPPFTLEKYIQAIKIIENNKYDVLIIDSLTHAWSEEGGILDFVSKATNQITGWRDISSIERQFKSAFLQSNMHIICTMRSKMDYVVEKNEYGKNTMRKIGLNPIQRPGMEYEFTTIFDIDMDHKASALKDRTKLFVGEIFQIEEQTGQLLNEWLQQGVSIEDMVLVPHIESDVKEVKKELAKQLKEFELNYTNKDVSELIIFMQTCIYNVQPTMKTLENIVGNIVNNHKDKLQMFKESKEQIDDEAPGK